MPSRVAGTKIENENESFERAQQKLIKLEMNGSHSSQMIIDYTILKNDDTSVLNGWISLG